MRRENGGMCRGSKRRSSLVLCAAAIDRYGADRDNSFRGIGLR